VDEHELGDEVNAPLHILVPLLAPPLHARGVLAQRQSGTESTEKTNGHEIIYRTREILLGTQAKERKTAVGSSLLPRSYPTIPLLSFVYGKGVLRRRG
jgi:hypothetical protein